MTGGFNPRGYKGKYSGGAGKNRYRNPQPGFGGGGGGGGGNKGCGGKKRIVQAFSLIAILGGSGVWGVVELFT